MSVTVELFGVPRARAGVAKTTARGDRLGEVLADLSDRFPQLGKTCFDQGCLRPGFLANLGGQRFVTDPQTRLSSETSLLILSADGGG